VFFILLYIFSFKHVFHQFGQLGSAPLARRNTKRPSRLFSVILSNFNVKLNYWQLLVKLHIVKCYEDLSSSPGLTGDGLIWGSQREHFLSSSLLWIQRTVTICLGDTKKIRDKITSRSFLKELQNFKPMLCHTTLKIPKIFPVEYSYFPQDLIHHLFPL
jgi:hypothetical protein